MDGSHEAAAADVRSPKNRKKAHDEDAGEVEDGEGVHAHGLRGVGRLEGGEKHSGLGFVGAEPEAPPSWDWIHLREPLRHLLRGTFLIPSLVVR